MALHVETDTITWINFTFWFRLSLSELAQRNSKSKKWSRPL